MNKKFFAFCVCIALLLLPIKATQIQAKSSQLIFSKSAVATKKIALTFDDGPHPVYTKKILDILKKYDVKATFFVIGINIENYPGIIEKIYADGNEIGNHSFSHTSEAGLTEEQIKKEFDRCEALIMNSTGVKPRLFRPPRGKMCASVEKLSELYGYSIVLWSIDTMDWAHRSPQNILKNIENNVRGGDIILMHDYISGENTTINALELLIPRLISLGYEFVTVSELIDNP